MQNGLKWDVFPSPPSLASSQRKPLLHFLWLLWGKQKTSYAHARVSELFWFHLFVYLHIFKEWVFLNWFFRERERQGEREAPICRSTHCPSHWSTPASADPGSSPRPRPIRTSLRPAGPPGQGLIYSFILSPKLTILCICSKPSPRPQHTIPWRSFFFLFFFKLRYNWQITLP